MFRSNTQSSGPVSNRSECDVPPVRTVIRQDKPWAAQQRHFPPSHFIPRRQAPANSVSTNFGVDERLSVTLSTTTVISRLSTGSIISASPTPLHFNQGKTGITKLNQLQVVVALLAFGSWPARPGRQRRAVRIEGQVQASGSPLANSTVTLWQASARA